MGSFAWARLSLLEVVYQLDIENLRVKPNWATMFRLGSFLSAAQFLACCQTATVFKCHAKLRVYWQVSMWAFPIHWGP